MSENEHPDGDVEDGEDLERSAEAEARRRLAIAQIRQYGDPVLRLRAPEVEEFGEELERLAERMFQLMHDAEGVGLAATQIGILRRLFVFSDGEQDRLLANPVLRVLSEETDVEDEGCLSLGSVRVPVERPTAVTLDARDASGALVSLELEGLPARIVQHELDHLDGTLIIDRTDSESRRGALAALRPRLVLGAR